MINVAHITPHVGGGVGAVLGTFFDLSKIYGIRNHLYCLDFCNSNYASFEALESRKEGCFYVPKDQLLIEVEKLDVILMHYWNHPITARFLSDANLPRERTIFWVHNSGLFEPNVIPNYLVGLSRRVLFTSSCSYDAPNLKKLFVKFPERFGTVHSTRSLEKFLEVGEKRTAISTRKNLLYVGTVSSAKMHTESSKIFAHLSRLGFVVQIIGGPGQLALSESVRDLGGQIEVLGPVDNVLPFLRMADIFIYPLRSDHYGTGEQVLLEAMASGLPVVAFNNPAERVILGDLGGLVGSADEFVDRVLRLAKSSCHYHKVRKDGISRVKNAFRAEAMVAELIGYIRECDSYPMVPLAEVNAENYVANDLYVYAKNSFFDGEDVAKKVLEDSKESTILIVEEIMRKVTDGGIDRWVGESKGTPSHYSKFFSESEELRLLVRAIESVLNKAD